MKGTPVRRTGVDPSVVEEQLGLLGLTPTQRASAQAVVLKGARLMLAAPGRIDYTQGPLRWQGINDKMYARRAHSVAR